MTRAKTIKRAIRCGLSYSAGRDVIKKIRRHFNAPKSSRGFKWVYAIEEFFT